ncbi:Tyrosine phosphatase Pyp1 [Balamuthia mandrillaris]
MSDEEAVGSVEEASEAAGQVDRAKPTLGKAADHKAKKEKRKAKKKKDGGGKSKQSASCAPSPCLSSASPLLFSSSSPTSPAFPSSSSLAASQNLSSSVDGVAAGGTTKERSSSSFDFGEELMGRVVVMSDGEHTNNAWDDEIVIKTEEEEEEHRHQNKSKTGKEKVDRGGGGGDGGDGDDEEDVERYERLDDLGKMVHNPERKMIPSSVISGDTWQELYDELLSRLKEEAPVDEYTEVEDIEFITGEEDLSESLKEENRAKNRYGNILPFDRTRVLLKPVPGVVGSDYINASYVNTSSVIPDTQRELSYIAASAPLTHTMEAWYRMIWEHKAFIIAMITRCNEGGRAKSDVYWPQKEGQENNIGSLKIKLLSEKTYKEESFIVRTMLLSKDGEEREVTQYHYLAWPDHGVPETSKPLEHIIHLINQQYDEYKAKHPKRRPPPLITHCSAGVGRTGTFIVIHTILDLLEASEKQGHSDPPSFDLVRLLYHLRSQRMMMIQQLSQYQFCYVTILNVIGDKLNLPRKSAQSLRRNRPASLTGAPSSGKDKSSNGGGGSSSTQTSGVVGGSASKVKTKKSKFSLFSKRKKTKKENRGERENGSSI